MVLLVEDNPDDERLAVRAFNKSGLVQQVVVARDGEEALRIVREADHSWKLILLDLKLPKVSGLEVLRAVREDKSLGYAPIVVLTSSDELSDIRESYRLGANSYLRKPVDFEQFNHVFKSVLDYWLSMNCAPI